MGATMRARPWMAGVLVMAGALALTACSSSSTTATTTSGATGSGTTGTVPSSTTTSGAPSTTSAASAQAANVPVTDQVRSELVAAAAALQNIPVAQFSGLAPGLTYYGLDKTTGIYWAGARLVAAPSADPSNPTQAQVSTQDEGSYYVFQKPSGGSWTAYADGNTGPGTPCPVAIPPAVLQVWGWPADSCRPSGI
jgi:hypothetical protein